MYAPHHLEQANTMFGPKIQGSNQGQQAQDKVWLIEDLAFANPRHGSPDGMATLLSDPDPTSPHNAVHAAEIAANPAEDPGPPPAAKAQHEAWKYDHDRYLVLDGNTRTIARNISAIMPDEFHLLHKRSPIKLSQRPLSWWMTQLRAMATITPEELTALDAAQAAKKMREHENLRVTAASMRNIGWCACLALVS